MSEAALAAEFMRQTNQALEKIKQANSAAAAHAAAKVAAGKKKEAEWLAFLEYMKDDAEVLRLARNPPLGVIHAGSEEKAILVWMAIHVNAWLYQWKGKQFVQFSRVLPNTPVTVAVVEIWVGHGGQEDAWTVFVFRPGPNTFRVQILKGSQAEGWEKHYSRIGSLKTNDQGHVGITTLPTGKEKGAKGGR